MAAPDFVAVGHVTLDHFGDDVRPGGAALFAAVTAHRLGLTAGILTSHGDDFPLDLLPPQIEVVTVDAPHTTVFEHRIDGSHRTMRRPIAARSLTPADVPDDWRDARLVLLAPVLDDVDPAIGAMFADATLAAAGQGWLRAAGRDGEVRSQRWVPSRDLLGRLQGLFLSDEDVLGQEAQMLEWLQRLPVAAVTAGAAGALLYVNGERYEIRPRPAREVDPTGAGDVFAAAFLIGYHVDGDPWQAAAVATCAASLSVEGQGWSTIPDRETMTAVLDRYRKAE
ncbi:MAG: hypothetical protein AUH30_09470 [Candidatus Rokubacteria bacterium 13_1_40CM_68_15]|nr:MAG: hypothetical protein AUH30_09470 [Candidatus Rokubacteria bacterium 13_1_40CM_68_15]